ncbi:STAS domain-containing protein [Anaerosinus massiliensis]|uniref:STAS domain-containing protein n=1 Tax=Massilibacillus massiliensis TaxID=1806837 RepID=UPI000DA61CFA|nr:anti-sigma factor antagonist [Massilibacillus massiliensis]
MEVTATITKGILIVRVIGEFDMYGAEKFRQIVDEYLHTMGIKDVVIDLKEVAFIDSSGIGVILGRYKKVMHVKGNICLIGVCDSVRKILELSGVLKILKVYDDEFEAVSCL